MTLIELTVVISLIILLVTILFVGANAWKRGSDRSMCVMHIQNVQKSVRAFSNLYGYSPGQNCPGLQGQIIGLGKFVENLPDCPGNGNYLFGTAYGTDTVPPIGTLYMECTLAPTLQHVPDNYADW